MAKNSDKMQIKDNVENPSKKQIKYWQNRAENTFLAGEKDAFKVARHLKSVYVQTSKEITEKINAFYGKYANETGLSLDEATQLLNKNELKDFKSYIKAMQNMGNRQNFSSEEMFEFKRLYNKARITRLDELQANIRGELDKLAVKTNINVKDLLSSSYENSYYKTIYNTQIGTGINASFSGLNKKAIEKVVSTKYQKANYSDRIWTNTNKLMQVLTQEIPRGLALGYNPRQLAQQVSKKLNTNYNNTVRLIRTEYATVFNEGTIDGYIEAGIKKYKLLVTLDGRTSDICKIIDSQDEIYSVKDAQVGINLPPFHPNCRTTTIPYFEKDYIDEMTDEELDQIGFVTYDDWKNGLVKFKDNKIIYNLERGD